MELRDQRGKKYQNKASCFKEYHSIPLYSFHKQAQILQVDFRTPQNNSGASAKHSCLAGSSAAVMGLS